MTTDLSSIVCSKSAFFDLFNVTYKFIFPKHYGQRETINFQYLCKLAFTNLNDKKVN